jgi:serpin B
MNWKILTGVAILLVVVIIGGIFIFREGIISLPEPKPKLSDIKNVVDANNQFALDYYSKLKSKDSGNIFFSPFSISSAFVMTYEAAKGQTAEEMRSVFYFPEDSNLRRTEYASIFDELNKGDKKYKLSSANALWAQQDYQFSKDYFENVEKYYGGKATNLDFKKDPEGSRITINNWVENQTNDKIQNLIPSGVIKTMTKLVLTNAVYFKGEWVKQFNKNDTKEEDFRTSNSGTVKAQMMQRTEDEAIFNYAENSSLQMLEMPYSGDELSILFLLPKNDNLTKLESILSTKNILDWKKNLEEQRVKVFIPKFKFETKYFMADDLKTMGMPLAFSDSADFSGMTATGKKDLKIDEAIHQAFVEVNEEGTEAAAATAIVMVPLGAAPGPHKEPKIPVFRADHPFMFLIQQKSTGDILFIGRVVNPNL